MADTKKHMLPFARRSRTDRQIYDKVLAVNVRVRDTEKGHEGAF